jgi:hypothetical protein
VQAACGVWCEGLLLVSVDSQVESTLRTQYQPYLARGPKLGRWRRRYTQRIASYTLS